MKSDCSALQKVNKFRKFNDQSGFVPNCSESFVNICEIVLLNLVSDHLEYLLGVLAHRLVGIDVEGVPVQIVLIQTALTIFSVWDLDLHV